MILDVNIEVKQMGQKQLMRGLKFSVEAREKVALIGRNGVGKTTLLNMLTGQDTEFDGQITHPAEAVVVATHQEYRFPESWTPIDYILHQLPEYDSLQQTIAGAAKDMGEDMAKLEAYSSALERFLAYDYNLAESKARAILETYQIPPTLHNQPFNHLSGGQKKFVDLARLELSAADLALIDEPTNHMDYVAKAAFIRWLNSTKRAVLVVSHDRDVLQTVDRILELKDGVIFSFPGNYDAYLRQNSVTTVTQIGQYELAERTKAKLRQQISAARAKKAHWTGTADTKNPFVVLEIRLTKQLEALEANASRPSFWIDQESVQQLNNKVVERYDRYKARNMRLGQVEAGRQIAELLRVQKLTVGYGEPLLKEVNFSIGSSERWQIKGRNGVGKTTLLRAIIGAATGQTGGATIFGGQIKAHPALKIGVYEQEISPERLGLPLNEAIAQIYQTHGLRANEQVIKQVLHRFLFDPQADYQLPVSVLSGGQKARLQLIAMLSGSPNLLILDEPTNHLDLPSIEELENFLADYEGAVLYVSHDSYFCRSLGGEVLGLD